MKLSDIRDFPTVIGTGPNGPRIHESCYRSYQLLQKVVSLLRQKPDVPNSVILEIIEDVETAPHVDRDYNEMRAKVTDDAGVVR